MIRSAASKAMWVGRTTAALIGLAIALAVVFGVATMALAAVPGDPFKLGKVNSIDKVSNLVGSVTGPLLKVDNNGGGPALRLETNSGKAPLVVNADSGTAKNLNADKLDGLDATQIGVSGLQTVSTFSATNSNSSKSATASCPAGKVAVGNGFSIQGGRGGTSGNQLTDVVITELFSLGSSPVGNTAVFVSAVEEEATNEEWRVAAVATCAKASAP